MLLSEFLLLSSWLGDRLFIIQAQVVRLNWARKGFNAETRVKDGLKAGHEYIESTSLLPLVQQSTHTTSSQIIHLKKLIYFHLMLCCINIHFQETQFELCKIFIIFKWRKLKLKKKNGKNLELEKKYFKSEVKKEKYVDLH